MTALHRCQGCQLLFRVPTTSAKEDASFYQQEYAEGFTTDCPSSIILDQYLCKQFVGTEKDYTDYINIISAAGGRHGDRLFDFGCSWGYGSWQLAQKGFSVESYEISKPRAHYARTKLGVHVHSSLSDVCGLFDIFFSAHVLEHIPSVQKAIRFAMNILKPGGLFVAFTPNGSTAYRQTHNLLWNKLWGQVHPNFLDDQFYRATFANQSHMVASDPYPIDKISQWSTGQLSDNAIALTGCELLVLVKK